MDNWNGKSDIKSTLDHTKDKISDAYHDMKGKVESTSEQLRDKASSLYEEKKEQISDLEENMEEYAEQLVSKVKEYPLTSLLVAGGVGFLLSRLLKK